MMAAMNEHGQRPNLDREQAQRELDALWRCPPGTCRLSRSAGGATGQTGALDRNGQRWFFKWLPDGDALAAEADGLRALAPAIRVPEVVHQGPLAGGHVLILEWLDTRPLGDREWARFGAALRQLHGVTGKRFGHHRDNWIGATPQCNRREDDWATFFVHRRLAPQRRLALERGLPAHTADAVEAVMARVPAWLNGLEIRPALLHGDLWQGNLAALADGTPVVYDPAVYHGHAETDLAMLTLFGSVPEAFYRAYGHNPREPEFQHRARLYNLYHLLNHHNLFGAPYTRAVQDTAEALLRNRLRS